MDNEKDPKAEVVTPTEVAFDYIKGSHHRVMIATGVHGGPTPNGKFIAASFFSERLPIPTREVYAVGPGGVIGERKIEKTESRHALVREVDATILFDMEVAIKVREWLDRHITALKQLNSVNQ